MFVRCYFVFPVSVFKEDLLCAQNIHINIINYRVTRDPPKRLLILIFSDGFVREGAARAVVN